MRRAEHDLLGFGAAAAVVEFGLVHNFLYGAMMICAAVYVGASLAAVAFYFAIMPAAAMVARHALGHPNWVGLSRIAMLALGALAGGVLPYLAVGGAA